MKKIFVISLLSTIVFASNVRAESVSYTDEVKALGFVAGQGLACGATKFQTFEMLARAILITKAVSNKAQADGMYTYNNSKADAYFAKQADGMYDCSDIVRRFDNQPIYQATLYADGSIKMPDGKLFTPRQPYDATMLYKDRNDREKARKIYDKGKNIKTGDITIKSDGSSQTVPVIHQGEQSAPAEPQIPDDNYNYNTNNAVRSPALDAGIGHIKRQ